VPTPEPTPSERAADDPAQQRWVAEPAKRAGRSAYQRDRARVLHSSALRRLAGKTQVVVPGEADFPRTRLTHSLECAQIGRELGAALGADPDLVETACLAHDLGHPPFGHTGESALDEVAADVGGFEGNAQSLRILTRLEAKAFASDGRSVGLNLTRASLDAACKYPWPRGERRRKYGVYDDDLDVFRWLRTGAPEGRLCLEAQVMDWSDDIAYSVHDLEDAVEAGHLDLDSLRDRSDRAVLVELTRTRAPGVEPAEVEEALDRLLGMPWWPASYDGSHRALAGLKNMTSQLIGRFAQAAEHATREAAGPAPLTRYAADLVVPRAARVEVETLKAVADRYVMSRDDATKRYGEQRTLVRELGEALLADRDRTAAEVRAVVDRIAQLTDASATALHARVTAG
jgi:dGTPase